jgi:hypothetical protein
LPTTAVYLSIHVPMNESSIKDELTEFLLYTTPNGNIKVEVFLHNENIRLNQDRMAELFDVNRTVITKHLKNIYQEGELDKNSTSVKISNSSKRRR